MKSVRRNGKRPLRAAFVGSGTIGNTHKYAMGSQ